MNFFQWLWENPIYFLWIYLGIITLVTFASMGIDKRWAKKGKRRVPESTLFLMALIGGSVGGVVGTYVFRHKTKHKSFVIGFPLILVLQVALGVFIYLYGKQ